MNNKMHSENKNRQDGFRKVVYEIGSLMDLIFSYRQTRNLELYLLISHTDSVPIFRVFNYPHSNTFRLEKLRGVRVEDRKRYKFDDLIKEITKELLRAEF